MRLIEKKKKCNSNMPLSLTELKILSGEDKFANFSGDVAFFFAFVLLGVIIRIKSTCGAARTIS